MAVDATPVVYVGRDSRETVSSDVAAHSIRRKTFVHVEIKQLDHKELRAKKLFYRPWLTEGRTGELIDLIDGKPFSTEYSHTRFLVPLLSQFKGWALYLDGDMIFLSDIKKLFALADDKYAIMCVKHKYQSPQNSVKLEGRSRQQYFRKNWSSFMFINCAHPSNRKLTAEYVNSRNGSDLHSLSWLDDHEIGSLPVTYNYISGISPKLEKIDVIHYTEGGPWGRKQDVSYSELWTKEYEEWCREADHFSINSMPKTTYDRAS